MIHLPARAVVAFVLFSTAVTACVAADATATKPVAIGDSAVDFTLPIVSGEGELTLSEEFKKGPVVLVVLRGYPGYQCPLCSRQVGDLVKVAGDLAKLSERVILVYPGEPNELEAHAEEFMGKTTLPEPIVLVRDPGLQMVSSWHLRWDAPNETAYPATFVIDGDGKVVWAKISDSHGGRTSATEVVQKLKSL